MHAALLGGLAWLGATVPSARAASAPASPVTVDAAVAADAPVAVRDAPTAIELRTAADARVDVAAPGAPTAAPNPDLAAGTAARSSGHGAGAPTLVTERADPATLRAQPYDSATGYALQRIETARRRLSREEVRATPHPDRTPWLASRGGSGHGRSERQVRAVASARARADEVDHAPPAEAVDSPGGFARPDVQQHPAATDAAQLSAEVSDRVDEALVSDEKEPAKLELSRPTSPGAATSGRGDGALGFLPLAHGAAPVPAGAPALPDARALAQATFQRAYNQYLQGVRQRVDPLWEFPRELAVRMEQGDVLVAFTIRRNGAVKDLRVLKGSGFDSFDKNVVAAIRKAAPFDPLPATLGDELRVTAPFEGSNPAIR